MNTINQLEEIIKNAKSGNKAASVILVEYLEPLAKKVAGYYRNKLSDGDTYYDDFFQEARIAILNAIDRFEIGKGNFTYFAENAMRMGIRKYLTDNYRVIKQPKGRIEKVVKLNKAYHELALSGVSQPSDEDLMALSGFTLKELKKVQSDRELQLVASLDYENQDEEDKNTLLDFLPYYDNSDDEMMLDELESALSLLEERKRTVLCSLWGVFGYEKKSTKELAELYSVSAVTIKNWEKNAIGELRVQVA